MIKRGGISLAGTGVYMAYPTTSELKPIYTGYQTMVNDQHTNVGRTEKSFRNRRDEYLRTFDEKVVFVPLAEIPVAQLDRIETKILEEMNQRFSRVGKATKWFNTNRRDEIKDIVKQIVGRELKIRS